VKAAARQLGISVSKLYQLVASRQISHYRIGGKILFSQQDIALSSLVAAWQEFKHRKPFHLNHD